MKLYDEFRFDYSPGVIRFGTGCIASMADELEKQGFDKALVVTGEKVADNPGVMNPVKDGLGDRLAGVFAEVTPRKRLGTAARALEAAREHGADVLVAVGGGSSLDVSKSTSILSTRSDSPEDAGRELAETRTFKMGDNPRLPIVAVPTTLAGADISIVAGVSATPENGLVDEPAGGGIKDRRLMPTAIFHDPELFATTPRHILAGSAMNGFNKGLETLYTRHSTPITDATATHGIALMADGLEQLGEGEPTAENLRPICQGLILEQFGIGRPDVNTLSLIHAFGHTLRDGFQIQQGLAHAVITPDALRYLFEHVDGRRDLLADALGVSDADDKPEAIASRVAEIRDGLGLPSRLRDIEGADKSILRDIAEATIDDPFMPNLPVGLEPTADDIEQMLEAAW